MTEQNKYKLQNNIEDSTEKLSYEEMRNKLKLIESDNQRINEQLFSLQNKYYVQTKILNDKSSELSKEVSQNQKIQCENEKILKSSEEIKKKIEEISKENSMIKIENKNIKTELNNIKKKLNNSNKK